MGNRNNVMVISFAISIAFWWLMLGSVEMALGFLALLFVHEMGHFLAAKHIGLRVSPPIFTPLGAAIVMEQMPASAKDEAWVAIWGPIAGSIASLVTLVLGVVLGVPAIVQLAVWGFFLNLFNLIPLAPLDGGRISMAIERRMWVLGLPAILFLLFQFAGSMFAMVVIFLILMQAWQDIQMRSALAASNPSYFDVGFKVRIGYGLAYLALGAFLFWAVTNPQGLIRLLVSLGI